MDYMDRNYCHHMGGGFRHRPGYPFLLGYARFDVFSFW